MLKNKPVRLLIYLAGSIFLAEAVIMLILPHLEIGSAVITMLIDASSLTIAIFPVLFWLVFRPLIKEIDQRKSTEAALREARDELEIRVRERTAELQKSNDELMRAHEQMVRQEKLASVGQLAAGVSHELNNPLGGILGFSQLILEKMRRNGLDKTTPEDFDNYIKRLSQVEQAALRCKTIVENLLKFARKSASEVKPLDINQVLEDTLTFTRHQLEINKVQVEKTLSPGLPQTRGNEHQLQQVFTNLMINAQQAMGNGGKLSISTKAEDGYIEVGFADTGTGIAPEIISKIFDPFFTTKPIGQGTGLGLSVSYGIVRDMGGKITVESRVGQGSTFRIWLPAAATAQDQGIRS